MYQTFLFSVTYKLPATIPDFVLISLFKLNADCFHKNICTQNFSLHSFK